MSDLAFLVGHASVAFQIRCVGPTLPINAVIAADAAWHVLHSTALSAPRRRDHFRVRFRRQTLHAIVKTVILSFMSATPSFTFPFLSISDPEQSGEGARNDPLGLASTGEVLADWLLPGLTSRMIRPRFLTAIAVSAAVCDGFGDEPAADRITPAYLVFEWLAVSGMAHHKQSEETLRTPGIEKVRTAIENKVPLGNRNYLKTPSVFGYHGVYKRLARHLSIANDDLNLDENGRKLLQTWETEQKCDGFSDAAFATGANQFRKLQTEVRMGLKDGAVNCSRNWVGWNFFGANLSPGRVGKAEASYIWDLLVTHPNGETRGEIFRLMDQEVGRELRNTEGWNELQAALKFLPLGSLELQKRLNVILAYEAIATKLDEAFAWLQFLGMQRRGLPVTRMEFATRSEVRQITAETPKLLATASTEIKQAPPNAIERLNDIANYFDRVTNAEELFEALWSRHEAVQLAKQPPKGKLTWIVRDGDGVRVRPKFFLDEPPSQQLRWGRPYRLKTVFSFWQDLKG